ncbi:hypothetical protein M9Y10_040722 [Tritrichomonas musculus]|uniref:Uncharacterized protein n=1 Tax=Tritrichomonas musculus TaxID=1915356 RepID=A0ABR2K3D9_9EUKA
MKKSKIGGKKSAKRKIQIRKFIESAIKLSYSDPFIEDDSEVEQCAQFFEPTKMSIRLRYVESNPEPFDDVDPDGILVKPNLEEADKFISSLKLQKNVSPTQNNKPVYKYVEKISKQELDAFRNQCEFLSRLKMEELKEDSDPEEYLI